MERSHKTVLLKKVLWSLSLASFIVAVSCGKKKSDDDETNPNESVTTGLAVTYPSTLALSSPATIAAATALVDEGMYLAEEAGKVEETKDKSIAEKQADNVKALQAGSADACRPRLPKKMLTKPTCFANDLVVEAGATVSVSSSLVKFPTTLANLESGKRGIRGGDAGITASKNGTEVCSVAVAQYYTAQVSDYVDRAQELVSKMICAAKFKGNNSPPAVGAKVDLLSTVKEVWNPPADTTITEAYVEGVGVDTYRSYINMSFKDKDGKERGMKVDLTNNPSATAAGDYNGRLIVFQKEQIDALASKGTSANFIAYNKSGTVLNTFFQHAKFNGDADGSIAVGYLKADGSGFNLKDVRTKALVNGDGKSNSISNLVQGKIQLNTDDGTGTMSYAWQAGNNDPATRQVVVKTKKETDGSFTGCGVAGYGMSFGDETTSEKVGDKMKGFYCGWAQTDGSTNIGQSYASAVQSQCFKRGAAETAWTVTTENLNYVVAADCGKSSAPFPGHYALEAIASDGKGTDKAPIPAVVVVPVGSIKTDDLKK